LLPDFFAAGRREAVERLFVLRFALAFFEDFFAEERFAPPFFAPLRRAEEERLADDFFAEDFLLLALRDPLFLDFFEERFFDAAIDYSPSQSSV